MTARCPYCGGRVRVEWQSLLTDPPQKRSQAVCRSCGAYGPLRPTESEAIAAFTNPRGDADAKDPT